MTTTLVRRTAKELAGAFYDNQDALRDGRIERTAQFRAAVGTQKDFVRHFWPEFVVVARQILAQMLTEPGRPQSDKDAIYDALLRERKFPTDEDRAAPSIVRPN